jgi:hypothetical protein
VEKETADAVTPIPEAPTEPVPQVADPRTQGTESEPTHHKTVNGAITVPSAKAEVVSSRTAVDDEVNGSLTWDSVMDKAKTSSSRKSRTLSGSKDKTTAQDNRQDEEASIPAAADKGSQSEVQQISSMDATANTDTNATLSPEVLSPSTASIDEPILTNGKITSLDISSPTRTGVNGVHGVNGAHGVQGAVHTGGANGAVMVDEKNGETPSVEDKVVDGGSVKPVVSGGGKKKKKRGSVNRG